MYDRNPAIIQVFCGGQLCVMTFKYSALNRSQAMQAFGIMPTYMTWMIFTVFCSFNEKVKLIDFGCAVRIGGDKETFGGTSEYMAPEVILSSFPFT